MMLATATRPSGETSVKGSLTDATVESLPTALMEDSIAAWSDFRDPEERWNTIDPDAAFDAAAEGCGEWAFSRSAPICVGEPGRVNVAL